MQIYVHHLSIQVMKQDEISSKTFTNNMPAKRSSNQLSACRG